MCGCNCRTQSSTLDQGLSDRTAGEDGFTTSRGSLTEDLSDVLKVLGGDPPLLSDALPYDPQGRPQDQDSFSSQTKSSSSASGNGSYIAAQGRKRKDGAQISGDQVLRVAAKDRALSPPAGFISPNQGTAAMPSDSALLSALVDSPKKPPAGSRCPLPHL